MAKSFNDATLFLAFAGLMYFQSVSGLYQLGSIYRYSYETIVNTNELPASGREIGYKIIGTVRISSVWQNPIDSNENLLKIELIDQKLHVHSVKSQDHHLEAHASPLDNVSELPSYLHWKNGLAIKIFLPEGDAQSSNNFKKGLASLFQIEPNLIASKTMDKTEVDVSGNCKVTYKTTTENLVEKSKTDCKLIDPSSPHYFFHSNDVQSVNVSNKAVLEYELNQESRVKNVNVRETVSLSVNLWRKAAISVDVRTRLSFIEEKQEGTAIAADVIEEAANSLSIEGKLKYQAQSLMADFAPRNPCSEEGCQSLGQIIEKYKENLKSTNVAKVKAANSFLRILERMRNASKDEIKEVLNNPKNKAILPQLLDCAAAAQTESSIGAAFDVVKFGAKKLDIPERFLLCLSLTTHPNQFVIEKILGVLETTLKNDKIKSTLIVSLGAVARTYCQFLGKTECSESVVIENAKSYLLKNAEQCQNDLCKLMFIRGLINFGSKESAVNFVDYAKTGSKQIAIAALKALKKIGPENLDEPIVKEIAGIYHQLGKQYDNTCRLLAIDIVFQSKSPKLKEYLRDFFQSLSDRFYPEVKSFSLSKLKELSENDPVLSEELNRVILNSNMWNYDTISHAGDSIAFSRPLSRTENINSSFGLNIETLGQGVTKQSSFDVYIKSEESNLHLMSVGIFAEGLGAIAGGGNEDGEEEETSAGMELVVMGVRLRPYVFFTGTGELMGHVWSGTGGELTTALQANFLIQDHYQKVALHNGLVADLNLQGALSTDLSGFIKISIWNRNCHSLVKTSGALLMHGGITLDTNFVKSNIEFTMGGESNVDFITDLEFSSKPFRSCIQMEQPPFSFRYNVRKAESVPGSKHLIKTLRKKTIKVVGKSFAMHGKNFLQCAQMLADS